MSHVGMRKWLKPACFLGSIPSRDTMKTHTITIKEDDFIGSKYETNEWHKRVNIVRWEHDFEKREYYITIGIK